MIKRIRKGNALLIMTIIMFAVSLVATSLTLYFAIGNRQVEKVNRYFNRRIQLATEADREYVKLLQNDNNSLKDLILNLNVKDKKIGFEYFTSKNKYPMGGYCVSLTDSTHKTVMISIRSKYSSTESKGYTYSFWIEQTGESSYSVTGKEAFEEYDN